MSSRVTARTHSDLIGNAMDMSSSRVSRAPLLVPLMSKTQKVQFLTWVVAWIAALVWFYIWWLRPEHNIGTFGFVLSTILGGWILAVFPAYFITFVFFSRVPSKQVPVPTNYRVAMIVTKVPSEPFGVVRETLQAMLRQTYSHDTWLADEDPSGETIAWCREHGVNISTRKGRTDYHRATWPRRTRCKEGNLAFFYDHYGYEKYEIVAQLDADHVPTETYLEEMLRPFANPLVGYVSAPSICDKNSKESWSARSRLYAESNLHGALQAGYTGGNSPLCFGSHYAVRTAALKEIGGLGPELAEDHSTTLMMNAHGWLGVHAIDAIAHGDGPQTFADLATQEFQWSRSLTTILLSHMPNYFGALPIRQKLQFGFSQIWYPLTGGLTLILCLLPLIALFLDANIVGVTFIGFFAHTLIISTLLALLALWIQRQGWGRPQEANVFSWESVLFAFARWPWMLLGSIAAVKDRLFGSVAGFRITPKGRRNAERPLPLWVLAPYVILSIGSGLPVILLSNIKTASGFYFLAALGSLIYALLLFVIVVKHWQENPSATPVPKWHLLGNRAPLAALLTFVIALPIVGTLLRLPQAAPALLWGEDHDPIFQVLSIPANAEPSKSRGTTFGVYDPAGIFSDNSNISVEHIFVFWGAHDLSDRLSVAWRYAKDRNRQLLVTVEPWSTGIDWENRKVRLFGEILAGQYDGEITTVCGEIRNTDSQVLVRWGHEMEGPMDRYPWAGKNPEDFIKVFRYFVRKCRSIAPKALFVWSPIGEQTLDRYFPGDAYVDYIGLSLYRLQAWDIDRYGQPRSFSESFEQKYKRVAHYKLPVIIAELGVSGDESYKRRWLTELSHGLGQFPLLGSVIYFNAKEPHLWPGSYGSPDWRVTPETFSPIRPNGG